ncbi:MAG: hypothetical protein IKU25_04660 [Clostridia bacterium]|nr:hypothetical protein [Clostridia bacterium]
MKNQKKIIIPLTVTVIVAIIVVCITIILLRNNGAPEDVALKFHNSLLPDYNTQGIEQCVGTDVYNVRFNDNGYFADRYTRSREQIVYYYGEDFSSELSDIDVYDASDSEKSSITREYKSKYSLEVDDVKIVNFTVTLSSEYGEKSRNQSLTVLKIGEDWFIYDYDAYWFAYM